jgi:hypothetical protein
LVSSTLFHTTTFLGNILILFSARGVEGLEWA